MMRLIPTSIKPGPIPFNVYTYEDGKGYVLFCRAGITVANKHIEYLQQRERTFYFTSDQQEDFYEYTMKNLAEIVGSAETRDTQKAQVIHDIGKGFLEKNLSPHIYSNINEEGTAIVNSIFDFLQSSRRGSEYLLAMTSTEPYLISHSLNVCNLSILVGMSMLGKNEEQLKLLGLAGLLHDMGKFIVSRAILMKSEKLDPDEMAEMRRHVTYGYQALKQRGVAEEVLAVVLCHHERSDGSGYPMGLLHDQIDVLTRIVSVVDVYDAITSKKPYKDSRSITEAVDEMASHRNEFDPVVMETLFEIVIKNRQLIEHYMKKYENLDPSEIPNFI